MVWPDVHSARNGSTAAAMLQSAMLRAADVPAAWSSISASSAGPSRTPSSKRRRRGQRHHRAAQQALQPDQRTLPRRRGWRFGGGLRVSPSPLSPEPRRRARCQRGQPEAGGDLLAEARGRGGPARRTAAICASSASIRPAPAPPRWPSRASAPAPGRILEQRCSIGAR